MHVLRFINTIYKLNVYQRKVHVHQRLIFILIEDTKT